MNKQTDNTNNNKKKYELSNKTNSEKPGQMHYLQNLQLLLLIDLQTIFKGKTTLCVFSLDKLLMN